MLPGISRVAGKTRKVGESHDAFTQLMLHFDGADGATVPVDSSGNQNVLFSDDGAVVSDSENKYGSASADLRAAGANFEINPTPASWQPGTGDFTVEFFVKFLSNSANAVMFSFASFGDGLYLRKFSSSVIDYYINNARTTVNWTPSINTWYHFCCERHNNVVKTYIDGTSIHSFSNSANIDLGGSTRTRIGNYDDRYSLDAYYDEFRYSVGIARYQGNFTPPTKPFG